MNSPIAALAWEVWRHGRRSVLLIVLSVLTCTVLNALIPASESPRPGRALLEVVFGVLMVLSFVLVMGIFNYTEFNSTREWHGFPYRLFTLPVATWKLVAAPMLCGLVTVELLFASWMRFVWNGPHQFQPECYAALIGVYMAFYQTTLWGLAAFRIVRTMALSFGGIAAVFVACLLLVDNRMELPTRWLSPSRFVPAAALAVAISMLIAWTVVARQRCGGGRRHNFVKAIIEKIIDRIPRGRADFLSPSAAQFWFEWRRTGLLLPLSTAFVLLLVITPVSWRFRSDPVIATRALYWIVGAPLVLAFAIGKGFVKPEFSSNNLSFPSFLNARPLTSEIFVNAKLKVAAVSAITAWILVLAYLAFWLPYCSKSKSLQELFFEFRVFYPRSWIAILILFVPAVITLTWRFMVSGLWLGLCGRRLYYFGSICVQFVIPLAAAIAAAICSDLIDRTIKKHPDTAALITMQALGWTLAALVIIKAWFGAFSWSRNRPSTARNYLFISATATLCFLALAVLLRPPMDEYRKAHYYILAALLLFPLARIGAAPVLLAKNRSQ
jgi:hypothetical protein